MPTTPKRWSAPFCPKAMRRWRRRKTRGSSSTTHAASAIRPNRRSSAACRTSNAREKVVGTLLSEGYAQVATPEDAGLVLYNTCSIRDKAEQKVFSRLQNFKREGMKDKIFGVLGCVAQQEGEKIFDRAPHVSLVAGSASYTHLGEM